MWRALLFLAFTAAPAYADITHRLQSSVQLTVDAAATNATRIGNTYSVSGVGVDTTDGTNSGAVGSLNISSGVGSGPSITATQSTAGNSFSFSQSYTQGDAIPTSAVTTGEVANFSNITSTNAGTAGNLAGTITTAGAVSVTAGGSGSTATGQYVSEITVR